MTHHHTGSTGSEILEQTDGRVDAFVAGAGTGGTMNQIRRIATARDDLILEERRKASTAAEADAMLVDMSQSGEAAE